MGAKVWRVLRVTNGGPQSTWSLSFLGSKNHDILCPWNVGESIVRVRVTGQFMYEVRDTNPTVTEMGSEVPGGEEIIFGVWANKIGGAAPPATLPPIVGDLRDEYVFYNQMTLTSLSQFRDQLGVDKWDAVWTYPPQDNDSHSNRGPNTLAGDIWLAWSFHNPIFEPMVNTTAGIAAFYNYALTFAVLIELP